MIDRDHHNQPSFRDIECSVTPANALVTFARQSGCVLLESVCDTGGYGRYSVLTANPISQATTGDAQGDPYAFLAETKCSDRSVKTPFSVAPGWFGYFPYEVGAQLHGVTDQVSRAVPRFGLYDTIALFDHISQRWRIVAADFLESQTPADHRLDLFEQLLRDARDRTEIDLSYEMGAVLVDRSMDHDAYVDGVRRAQSHIAAGDIYQVNLTQRFTFECNQSPTQLYQHLRRTNPASFAAYVADGDRTAVSSSPELFLQLSDNRVVTRPIKGTAPRSDNPHDDSKIAARLAVCEKNRAELNMIIDLMRNDLGRVCQPGTIRVIHDGEIETHPTVLHRVATIEGALRDDMTAVDLIRAAFPGGSVTGCPKIRAMHIIRELEPTPRDVYCGSIGYIDMFGRVNLNIAIRTLLCENGRVHLYAGGAITADSNAADEYDECMAKAAGMIRALGANIDDLKQPAIMTKESAV